MNPSSLFETNLAVIDGVIAMVCRRARLHGADAEDFASSVRIALMENDYAILRQYAGRSSFATYLGVVVQRLLLDQRSRALGRWRPSREAERFGEAGVLLETLLHRDLRTLEESLPIIQRLDGTITRERAAGMAARFPLRITKPRAVDLDEDVPVAGSYAADDRVVDADRRRLSAETSRVVRKALAALPDEDAMILRFRFASEMSIADISRMLRLPQRPLYRRLESLIARLRAALAAAGLNAGDVIALVGEAQEMDFGLADGKTDPARQSLITETRAAEEGR
ncbi:MAG TPA: sigma-70 family RNA polymerase sigma factor [Thermoanaerobaculia bacterium]|nr:sigma-70 family RNA polymerase sigma factor [Thermoanaerobaculia bacterium]